MRAGRDWQAERLRYLIHFSDGGATPRSPRATSYARALSDTSSNGSNKR
jgi:hypothetical protein